jgi:uncharacterized protein
MMTNEPSVVAGSNIELDLAQLVSDYLRMNPDFFVERVDLLTKLTLPHATGGATSLLERQVQVLREQLRQINEKFRELLSNARDSEVLSQHMHALTVQLLQAASVTEVIASVYERLQIDFKAEFVSLRLFVNARGTDFADHEEFVVTVGKARTLFAPVFSTATPWCGRLDVAQQSFMFGSRGAEIGSAVLVPLAGNRWEGLLAVASRDPRRYYAGMGVDLMRHLGDLTSLALNSHPPLV